MQTRMLGKLWPVSALTLGGGGLGQLWGVTSREEAVATVREAVRSELRECLAAQSRGPRPAQAMERVDRACSSGTV